MYVIEVQFGTTWNTMVRCVNVDMDGNVTPCTLDESLELLKQSESKYSWPLRLLTAHTAQQGRKTVI